MIKNKMRKQIVNVLNGTRKRSKLQQRRTDDVEEDGKKNWYVVARDRKEWSITD
jgi:hypothetical protein